MESEALGLENVVGIFAILGLAMIFTALSLPDRSDAIPAIDIIS